MTSLCTITVPPHVFDDGGAPDPNAPYTPLAGHENIPCTAPPPSEARVQATEIKDLAEIMSKSFRHVLLGGYFPLIISDYRALIDGVEYDILGVEDDSQYRMTRLGVQLATV